MRIIFAGTPEFAAHSLNALIDSNHDVIAVLTQPDRPSGRGRKPKASPIKQLAQNHGVDVFQPQTLKDNAARQLVESFKADVMVVVAYGMLLPKQILNLPKYGCLNIHASLLPRWRGAAPIQRAIEAGDEKTGISIMQMDEGLDTGDVVCMSEIPIVADDTAATLHDKLARLGAQLIVRTLHALQHDQLEPVPQDNSQACYAVKLSPEEALIDWQQPAQDIVNKIQAFNPWPGAKTHYQQTELKLLRAKAFADAQPAAPGTIVECGETLVVQTGEQALEILELQKSGGRPMKTQAFLNGFEIKTGELLA